jgi:hypothetical protein
MKASGIYQRTCILLVGLAFLLFSCDKNSEDVVNGGKMEIGKDLMTNTDDMQYYVNTLKSDWVILAEHGGIQDKPFPKFVFFEQSESTIYCELNKDFEYRIGLSNDKMIEIQNTIDQYGGLRGNDHSIEYGTFHFICYKSGETTNNIFGKEKTVKIFNQIKSDLQESKDVDEAITSLLRRLK